MLRIKTIIIIIFIILISLKNEKACNKFRRVQMFLPYVINKCVTVLWKKMLLIRLLSNAMHQNVSAGRAYSSHVIH